MTIQKNEKNENKHLNTPLSYTKEEKQFIKLSFRIVRERFEEELDITNEEHVRKAIKLYHDRYHMPGGRPHQLMREIFRGMGYWEDGKTTLEERERKIIEEKTRNERRLAEMNLARKKALDAQLEAIQKEKEQIENDPIMRKFDLTKEYSKIEAEIQHKVEVERDRKTLDLQKFLTEQEETYQATVKKLFEEAERTKGRILENAKKEAILKTQEKLTDALVNLEKIAPKETSTEKEIIKRNAMIDLELQNLENKTVVQLREFAKSNDIEWTYTMRKDELIEHIQNTLNKNT